MSTQLPRPDLVSKGCWGEDATCEGAEEAQGPSVPGVIEVGLQRIMKLGEGLKLGEGPPVKPQTKVLVWMGPPLSINPCFRLCPSWSAQQWIDLRDQQEHTNGG